MATPNRTPESELSRILSTMHPELFALAAWTPCEMCMGGNCSTCKVSRSMENA